MKTYTINRKGILHRLTRFFGAMLTVALILPAAAVSQPLAPVNLGTAGNFVILTKTGISATGVTQITGDIGVSPIASTAITGFGLIADPSNTFSTSSLVTGNIYAADYAPPTPANMTTAVSDMETAYTNAAGRTLPDATELGAGNISGLTLAPGLYKWSSGVTIPNGVTLSGSANDVWIFQIAQTLTVGNGAVVTLSGGAQAKNIFWAVAGAVTLGTTSDFKGIILCQTAIVLNTGATLDGRALAQTAVTLDANVIGGTTNSPLRATKSVPKSSGSTIVQNGSAPQEFTLSQNYPNPFNPSTKIQYTIGNAGLVSLKVYDVLGHEVATLVNSNQEAGSYTVPFNTGEAKMNLSSGVYFYRLEAGSFVSIKKLTLLK